MTALTIFPDIGNWSDVTCPRLKNGPNRPAEASRAEMVFGSE